MSPSAPFLSSKKAKGTRQLTTYPPCAGRSKPPEFGWFLIKRVPRAYCVEMPDLFLMILQHRNALPFEVVADASAGHRIRTSWDVRVCWRTCLPAPLL
jgi:hypothetical protein